MIRAVTSILLVVLFCYVSVMPAHSGFQDKGKELAAIFYEEGFKMVVMNKFMAHVILENAMKLNPLYENDEQFYLAYSVRSANKAADMIKGGELFIRRFT